MKICVYVYNFFLKAVFKKPLALFIFGGSILCWGDCPVCCRMFGSVSALVPLRAGGCFLQNSPKYMRSCHVSPGGRDHYSEVRLEALSYCHPVFANTQWYHGQLIRRNDHVRHLGAVCYKQGDQACLYVGSLFFWVWIICLGSINLAGW